MLEDILINEKTDLYALLLQSGHLTLKRNTKDVYILPNFEVESAFYKKIFPVWSKLKFNSDIKIENAINE